MAASVILALDIASTVGWALLRHGGLVTSGTYALPTEDYGEAGIVFEAWLLDKLAAERPLLMIVERPFYRGAGDQVYLLNGLAFTAQCAARASGVARTEYTAGEARRALGLPGNAKKREVVAAVERLGHVPANDHEADAIALIECWRARRRAEAA